MDDDVQVVKQATVPAISPMPIRKKSMQKVHDEKLKRRQKSFSTCQTMKMQLSSKLLCLRKKKFKRSRKGKLVSRKGKLVSRNLIQKSLVDGEIIPADLEPSTSQKYQTPSGGFDHPRRGKKKFGSKKKEKSCVVNNIVSNINGDSMTNNEVESVERAGQKDAKLLCSSPTEKFSVSASAGNSLNATGPYYPKYSSKESMQNGLMSVLTRGLEETGNNYFMIILQPFVKVRCYTRKICNGFISFLVFYGNMDFFFFALPVARWDEIGSNTREKTERSAAGNGSIGHIGDEW